MFLLASGLAAWLVCFYLNRLGNIVPKIGGGCFGGDKPPNYQPPDIKIPSAGDLYGQANDFWKTSNPTLYNAQSNALNNANNPNYYASFQPTSFENAMGNQYFKNVWPDTEAYMKNQLSQSGMINTPGAAQSLGQAMGNIETNIGSYLSGQGDQRATGAINAGLGIPLSGLLNPFVQTGQQQSNTQNNWDLTNSQLQYQNSLNNYQYGQQQNQAFGGTLGALGGLALAPFTGGMSMAMPLMGMGSQLGTGAAGGAMNPYALAYSGMGMSGMQNPFSSNTPNGQSYQGYNLGYGGGNNPYTNFVSPGKAAPVFGY